MSEMPRETTEYDDTMEALRQAENALPDFTSSYDGEIRRLFERIVNRPAFRYDPGSDPLYQSARTQLMEAGSRAMRDTQGRAAALTGGYGSSYAQSVGQQQYGAYLEKLGQAMPELYEAAYERYRREGAELQAQLGLAKGLAESERAGRKERFDMAASLEQQRYERGEKSYQKLVTLITQSGYVPNEQELKAAGMKREQAEALRSSYLLKNPMAMMLPGFGG